MTFAYPDNLYWLPLLLVLVFLLWRNRKWKGSLLSKLMDPKLIEKMFPYSQWKKKSLRQVWMKSLAVFFMVISLAGPQIGRKLREIKSRGSNLMILLDASDSMIAEDLKPNRMEVSKRLLGAILENLNSQRVGIIAFAGAPYVYCPLTCDLSAVKQFLKTMEPGMIPQPGTRIGDAVRLALSKFPEGKSSNAILLLSDGEDHRSDPLGAAEDAKRAGVKIFSIGIGSLEGEPIPVKDNAGKITGFRKDRKGNVVLSRLGEEDLAHMALTSGGSYFRATGSGQEVDLLTEKLAGLEKEDLVLKQNDKENRYQWFLFPALVLLLLSETSLPLPAGKALSFFLLFAWMAVPGAPCYSESFREDMKDGNKWYEDGKYEEAQENYEKAAEKSPSDPRAHFNLGAADYKLQDWEKAGEEFQKSAMGNSSSLAEKSYYNLANSLVKKGDYSQAIASYQQALKLDPKDEDAKYNLQVALLLQKNPPPKQKNKKSEKKKDGKKDGGQSGKSREEKEKQEKEEAARRMLKGVSDSGNDKPVIKLGSKKDKKEYEEDW